MENTLPWATRLLPWLFKSKTLYNAFAANRFARLHLEGAVSRCRDNYNRTDYMETCCHGPSRTLRTLQLRLPCHELCVVDSLLLRLFSRKVFWKG